MIRLGVTGGIGSGKSTLARSLERIGQGVVLDADEISRQSTAPGGVAIAAITRSCGSEFIASDGGLNRTVARQRAFSDPSFRQILEAIIHPIVRAEIERIEAECKTRSVPLLIYDIPLLVESGQWRNRLDQILVVDCSEATQVQRVQSRNKMQENQVRAIMGMQASRTQRLACADIVVCNDGISLLDFEKECQQVSTILRCRN